MSERIRFERDNEQHAANACVELPADYFVRAVDLAQRIRFGTGSDYSSREKRVMGLCEQHPAIREVCDWWNLNAPETPAVQVRSAGFFIPWVRISDDSKYHCDYADTPSTLITAFRERRAGQARIGDFLLIEFLKGARAFRFHAIGTEVLSVMGAIVVDTSARRTQIESGDYDEAWYTLHALALFPCKFPDAWAALLSMTDGVWGAWKRQYYRPHRAG
jgi:hypothetical protein